MSRPGKDKRMRLAAWTWFRRFNQTPQPVPQAAPEAPNLASEVIRKHLAGVLEALLFASEKPMSLGDLTRAAKADRKMVKNILDELVTFYRSRGFSIFEVAGGYAFRTSPEYAPFVRDLTGKKPVRMSRAQVETLAIIAYRQPVTRPEVDEIRGVDSGAVLKALLERELIRILGKREEPGRPMIYGTTPQFLEFFGLRALSELPTLREFTELTDESRGVYERETGEPAPVTFDAGGLVGGEGTIATEVVPPVEGSGGAEEPGDDVAASAEATEPMPNPEPTPPAESDDDESDDDESDDDESDDDESDDDESDDDESDDDESDDDESDDDESDDDESDDDESDDDESDDDESDDDESDVDKDQADSVDEDDKSDESESTDAPKLPPTDNEGTGGTS